ncbi:DUF2254 domain-containing protein [Arthrobacter dokdonensis]|uniref:DUF2254 domain-containing protein n=1 Tax=Arthrobacter dokdonellae TaxID=2211210 RepID=UPI000DE57CC7|nr:DUF2254 domain-containing protein [Arthrobacter dokdonellae]
MNGSIHKGLHVARDAFRAQLWPLPIAGVVLAVLAGVLLPHLDAHVDGDLPGWLDALVFSGDPGASRTVLDAVAGSLITVTALTFSLTVVTLQLASSQFSPRLLRNFTQDLFVQVTLALFLATFTYSLTVLRVVRSSGESASAGFVPRLAVTTSFLLALASVVGLVLFLAHLTRQIRVETMLSNVHMDASLTASTNLPNLDAGSPPAPQPPSQPAMVSVASSGFLVRVDQGKLLHLADSIDAVISLYREPGEFLLGGTPLASYWPRGEGSITDPDDVAKLRKGIHDAVSTGPERTAAQDVGYGLRQLTDVVNKALSPGINDPTTAVHALGHTAALLAELMGYQLGATTLTNDNDVPRVILARPTFAEYLDSAITQPRKYGTSDPMVASSLYQLLWGLACNAPSQHHPAIADQLERLQKSVARQAFDNVEQGNFARWHRKVLAALLRQQDGDDGDPTTEVPAPGS